MQLPKKKRKKREGGKLSVTSPLTLSIIFGFIIMFFLLILNYNIRKEFEFRNTIEIIVSSFLSASAIIYSIFGLIYFGLFNEMYPGVDQSSFNTIVTIGGVVTVAVTLFWINGLIAKPLKKRNKK